MMMKSARRLLDLCGALRSMENTELAKRDSSDRGSVFNDGKFREVIAKTQSAKRVSVIVVEHVDLTLISTGVLETAMLAN